MWQWISIVVLVLLPMALMIDFHPKRERLDSRGRPLGRDWPLTPTLRATPPEDQ